VIPVATDTTPGIAVADLQVAGDSSRAHAAIGPDQYPLRILALRWG
jgi:hypothetical protein